jgi:L-fuconolactonase
MRIDAHLHFWKPSCGFDNRPIADHAAYRRDFMPADVMDDLDACDIDGVILVQTCPQTEETDWIVDLASREERVWGVTAWVNLDGPPCDFESLACRPKVVGIRAQLRRVTDASFVARPAVVANLGRALEAGLNVTVLAEARHYDYLAAVLEALPPGPVTINHLALPFPDVDRTGWQAALRNFARRPEVYLQFSGVPFLFGERWCERNSLSVLDEAFTVFGAERLMFASDWPMLLRFATYGDWVRAVEDFLSARDLADSAVDAVFAGNARRANPLLHIPAKFLEKL